MQKKLAWLLCLALLLSGCGAEEIPGTDPLSLETSASQPEQTELLEENYVSLHYTQDRMETFDPETGKTKVLNFDFPWVQVTISGNPEASGKITEYLKEENTRFIEGIPAEGDLYAPLGLEEASRHAREGYEMFQDDFLPYAVERTYELLRGNDRILCILAQDYAYLGGAHGSCMRKYLVFDTETGRRLTFGDLTDGPNGLWAAAAEKMQNMALEDPEISGRMDLIEKKDYYTALSGLIREGSWFLEGDSLCFESQEYELGAYAAGMIRFDIPLKELNEHIKPQYLPDQKPCTDLILAEHTDLPSADRIQYGEFPVTLYLCAEGCVRNAELFTLEPYASGEGIYPGHTLWACGEMENCALELSAEIPEMIPNLGLSYEGPEGQKKAFAITQSGENGDYFLMSLDLP